MLREQSAKTQSRVCPQTGPFVMQAQWQLRGTKLPLIYIIRKSALCHCTILPDLHNLAEFQSTLVR